MFHSKQAYVILGHSCQFQIHSWKTAFSDTVLHKKSEKSINPNVV